MKQLATGAWVFLPDWFQLDEINSVAWSPDSACVAAPGGQVDVRLDIVETERDCTVETERDCIVRVWDAETGDSVRMLKACTAEQPAYTIGTPLHYC